MRTDGAALSPANPSAANEVRPLWSVMIPTYNPTPHLRDAIVSAQASLSRCGASAQLELIDDASSVNVEAMIREWGLVGVQVYRRPVNGGLGHCWNTCIDRASGSLIHILHQDDLVKPAFYERMSQLAHDVPTAGMYFCRPEFLDDHGPRLGDLEQAEEGLIERWLEKICSAQRVQCSAVVVRRQTYARIGRFEPSLRYVIDWEMWIRIAAATGVAYLPEALAVYRMHATAETRRVKTSGIATRDFAIALGFIRKTLDDASRPDCLASANKFAIDASDWTAQEAEAGKNRRAAAREVRASLRYLSGSMGWRYKLRQARWYVRLLLGIPPLRRGRGR